MTAPEKSAMTRITTAREKLQELRDVISKRTGARSAKIASVLAEVDDELEAALNTLNNSQCIIHAQADRL